jgi:hypothetical protein
LPAAGPGNGYSASMAADLAENMPQPPSVLWTPYASSAIHPAARLSALSGEDETEIIPKS